MHAAESNLQPTLSLWTFGLPPLPAAHAAGWNLHWRNVLCRGCRWPAPARRDPVRQPFSGPVVRYHPNPPDNSTVVVLPPPLWPS